MLAPLRTSHSAADIPPTQSFPAVMVQLTDPLTGPGFGVLRRVTKRALPEANGVRCSGGTGGPRQPPKAVMKGGRRGSAGGMPVVRNGDAAPRRGSLRDRPVVERRTVRGDLPEVPPGGLRPDDRPGGGDHPGGRRPTDRWPGPLRTARAALGSGPR